MEIELYRTHLSDKLIRKFKSEYKEKLGVIPYVFVGDEHNLNISLFDVLKTLNEQIPDDLKRRGIEDIRVKDRYKELVCLRMIFCKIAHNIGFTKKTIGNFLGGRDHTTIIHALKAFDDMLVTDLEFRSLYNTCMEEANNKSENYESTLIRAAA